METRTEFKIIKFKYDLMVSIFKPIFGDSDTLNIARRIETISKLLISRQSSLKKDKSTRSVEKKLIYEMRKSIKLLENNLNQSNHG